MTGFVAFGFFAFGTLGGTVARGRFLDVVDLVLGLGTQVKGHNELRYATPWTAGPGPRLREYVQCVQAMFAGFTTGKPVPFEGKHYHCEYVNVWPRPFQQPHPPIFVVGTGSPSTMAAASSVLAG